MLVKNSQSSSNVFKFYRTINKICSKNSKFKLNITSIEGKPYACILTDDSFYIYNLENISIQFYVYCGERGINNEKKECNKNIEYDGKIVIENTKDEENSKFTSYGCNPISFYCLNKWNVYICYRCHVDVYFRGDILGRINFPEFSKIIGAWKFGDDECLILTHSTNKDEETSTIYLIQKNEIKNYADFNYKILSILVPKNYKNKILILDSKNSLILYNLKSKNVIYKFKNDFSETDKQISMVKNEDISDKKEFIISMFWTDVDDVILIYTNKNRILGFNVRKDKVLVNFNNFIPRLNNKKSFNVKEWATDKKSLVYKLSNAMVCGKFGLFIFSRELEIWDLELKVKIFYKFDVVDAFMINPEMFLLINEAGIYIYEYNGNKFDILKKRETLGSVDFISGNEDLIIGNSKSNEIMAINIFKDQQNRYLLKNYFFEKIITSSDSVSLENINNFIIYGNEKVYLLNKGFKKKNCSFLIDKKCEWVNFNSDILICGTDENIVYLINMHSKRIMAKFKVGNEQDRILDGILEFDKIILLFTNRIIELNFDYKILKSINLSNPKDKSHTQINTGRPEVDPSIKKIGNFYFIFKNNELSIAKDSISRTFKCENYFVDESINYIGLINGNNIQIKDIVSGIIFSDIQLDVEIKSGVFSSKMQFMILLDKNDGHIHLFSNNSFFNKNKNKNLIKHRASSPAISNKNIFNTAENFVCDLNRSLELSLNNNNKSLGLQEVLPKLNTNLYKEILLFKSCLSKNDVEFYLKSLNKEEVNLLLRIMIKVDKKTKTNNRIDNSILLNRLLLYKSKFIDSELIDYFLNSYVEEMSIYDDGIIKAINYMRI